LEIIRPSERQLIFKTYGNVKGTLYDIGQTTALWIVIGLLSLFWIPIQQIFVFNPMMLIPYLTICFFVLGCICDHTATFDLDLNLVTIERYWLLFKKRHCQEYDLSIIRTIFVEKPHESVKYVIILKQYNNKAKDIYIPSPDSSDRSIVDIEAQKIRDFLRLKIN
jgi:hypothetical protein